MMLLKPFKAVECFLRGGQPDKGMGDKMVLILCSFISGLACCVPAVPLIQGTVPPNTGYGFRLDRILADEDLWYAANAVGGRWMFAAGMGLIVASALCCAYARELSFVAIGMIVALAVALLPMLAILRVHIFVWLH